MKGLQKSEGFILFTPKELKNNLAGSSLKLQNGTPMAALLKPLNLLGMGRSEK